MHPNISIFVNFLNSFGIGMVLNILNGMTLVFYFFAGIHSAAIPTQLVPFEVILV